MGSDVGQNPDLVRRYCEVVSGATHLPVIAKMTPNIGNMEIPAIAAMEGGAKGIAAINTVKAITNIDVENMTAMPVVNGKSSISGYSGAAVKPIALRFITQNMERRIRLYPCRIFKPSGNNIRYAVWIPYCRRYDQRSVPFHGRPWN